MANYKKMAEKVIHNVFVLDRSGSMNSCWTPTISGLNEQISTTKHIQEQFPDQVHTSTLVIFDNEIIEVYSFKKANEIKEVRETEFPPRNSTALFDAIGQTITNLEPRIGPNDQVVFTILTDGYENASVEYQSYDSIKAMIDRYQEKGNWIFNFMGASKDVMKQAEKMGIFKGNTMNYEGNATMAMDSFTDARINYSYASSVGDVGPQGPVGTRGAGFFASVDKDDEEKI